MDVGMFLCRQNHSQGRFKRFPDPHFKDKVFPMVISLLNKKPSKTAYVPNTPAPFTFPVHRETVIFGSRSPVTFVQTSHQKNQSEKKTNFI